MERSQLLALAEVLSLDGQRGWLTPDGTFFDAGESPGVRIVGLELGPHEQAALDWLTENRPDLHTELEELRTSEGFVCWEETDGLNIIKGFMFRHGETGVRQQILTKLAPFGAFLGFTNESKIVGTLA